MDAYARMESARACPAQGRGERYESQAAVTVTKALMAPFRFGARLSRADKFDFRP